MSIIPKTWAGGCEGCGKALGHDNSPVTVQDLRHGGSWVYRFCSVGCLKEVIEDDSERLRA